MKRDKIVDHYKHSEALRVNNPDVGLVKGESDQQDEKQTYAYDPHIDPSLQWAGKEERSSFNVDTRSIYVNERIDPKSIIEKIQKEGNQHSMDLSNFFEIKKRTFSEAINFYNHQESWSNRLIAGDSGLIMNSLLQREEMGGKVQCIYMDPPYGIKYSSNFQPYYDASSDKNPSTEPEMIKAFRDTWELGIHSYLSYLRDRIFLSRKLLNEKGSMFVQIGDENVHHVREIMDEVFGVENYVSLIAYKSTSGTEKAKGIRRIHNYLIWYAKDKNKFKFNRLFKKINQANIDIGHFHMVENSKGEKRKLTAEERVNPASIDKEWKLFSDRSIFSTGNNRIEPREFNGKEFTPSQGSQWRHTLEGFEKLKEQGRIIQTGKNIRSIRYLEDFPYQEYTTNWDDTGAQNNKHYVVQTSTRVIRNCILMASDPGDLVFDPTCGGGTTAYIAEETGRRWITCDTSRISLALTKQRLLTSAFDYYELADKNEGVNSGFLYQEHERPRMNTLANEEEIEVVKLYDQPIKDAKRLRVCGPFTVEGLPSLKAPEVISLTINNQEADSLDNDNLNITLREWCAELRKNGIRAKAGNKIEFNEIKLTSGLRNIHAEGETREASPKKVMISFGPQHSTLGSQQVEDAWHESKIHRPDILLFVSLQFDAEANKSINTIPEKQAGVQILKVQMDSDYSVSDLKKQVNEGDSFWLLGEPDVQVNKIMDGKDKGKVEVVVKGFDYYNPIEHKIKSSGKEEIACWLLDENYDGRCLVPNQVFLPMAKNKQGWKDINKNLKAVIDEDLLQKYTGNVSVPFEVRDNKTIAVKIIDKRGVESLQVINL